MYLCVLRALGGHGAALGASAELGAGDAAVSKGQPCLSWYRRVEGDGKEHRMLHYNVIHLPTGLGSGNLDSRVGVWLHQSVLVEDDCLIYLCCVASLPEFLPIILVVGADDGPSVLQAAIQSGTGRDLTLIQVALKYKHSI